MIIEDENISIKKGYGSNRLEIICLPHLIINEQTFRETAFLNERLYVEVQLNGQRLETADKFLGQGRRMKVWKRTKRKKKVETLQN